MEPVKTISKKHKLGYLILITLGVIAIIGVLLTPPLNQDTTYHNFSDTHTFLGIPNFWNVVSNLPFLIVGFLGLYKLETIAKSKMQYATFFVGIMLVAIGSSYYHFYPDNTSLVWDRLPMTIVFMSIISIIISEFVNCKNGKKLLIPLLLLGVLSVLYWVIWDDLKFYTLVQFYPMLAIPIVLVFFKSKFSMVYGYWLLLLAYLVAKVCEYFDSEIFNTLKFISGHSLKHFVSSIGLFVLVYCYVKRGRRVEANKID